MDKTIPFIRLKGSIAVSIRGILSIETGLLVKTGIRMKKLKTHMAAAITIVPVVKPNIAVFLLMSVQPDEVYSL